MDPERERVAMPARPPPSEAVWTEALLGVLEIAWEGQPPETLQALRVRVRTMPSAEKQDTLRGLVRLERIGALLQAARAGRLTPSGRARRMEPWQDALVSRALEPLAQLAGLADARRVLDALEPELRAEILLQAVAPPGPAAGGQNG